MEIEDFSLNIIEIIKIYSNQEACIAGKTLKRDKNPRQSKASGSKVETNYKETTSGFRVNPEHIQIENYEA